MLLVIDMVSDNLLPMLPPINLQHAARNPNSCADLFLK